MKTQLLIILIAIIGIANAQTNVSGGIYSNTTWTKANSPYIVIDTIVVFPGVTLTIQPGVTVEFSDNKRIEIRQAKIIAIGTTIDSITFTSNSPYPTLGIYSGILLNGGNLVSQFNYCNFQYADNAIHEVNINYNYTLSIKNSKIFYTNFGIQCPDLYVKIDSCVFRKNNCSISADGTITNCIISNNHNGITQISYNSLIKNCILDSNKTGIYGARGTLLNCIIKYNTTGVIGGEGGIMIINNCIISSDTIGISTGYCDTIKNSVIDSNIVSGINIKKQNSLSHNYIYNCRIKNNGIGIHDFLPGGGKIITKNYIENNSIGIYLEGADSIFCNRICNNINFDLKYTGANNIFFVTHNYWCTPDSASTEAVIYDGYDNINYGLVFFMPVDSSCAPSNPTSINELANTPFNIYPNPSSGNFIVNGIKEKSNLIIFNTLGEKVYQSSISNPQSVIDISSQCSGIYFLNVKSENNSFTQKLIIQK